MKFSIISFTERGLKLSQRIQQIHTDSKLYTKYSGEKNNTQHVQYVHESVYKWSKIQFEAHNVQIFVGACGIAVRAISPNIKDKLNDSPVIVIDENSQYVIPVLSGHVGGGNEIAVMLAKSLSAIPVITTATDINHRFAVDLFAKKNNLHILNKEGIAKVSSKVLSGQIVTMAVDSRYFYSFTSVPEEIRILNKTECDNPDILVTGDVGDINALITLVPKEFYIGIGCKRGTESEKIEEFISEKLKEFGISIYQIAGIASIDLKKNEHGIVLWCNRHNLSFLTYTTDELRSMGDGFTGSEFVKEQVGVDNVCERAALKASGENGTIIFKKQKGNGITMAIAKREWRVTFDEK